MRRRRGFRARLRLRAVVAPRGAGRDACRGGGSVDAAIEAERAPAPESALMGQRHFIDGCFAAATLPAILEEIDDAGYGGSEFALATYDTIRAKVADEPGDRAPADADRRQARHRRGPADRVPHCLADRQGAGLL